jgi:hypothetical protein
MRLTRHAASKEYMRNELKYFLKKYEGTKLLGRPRRRLEDKSKMALNETGCEGMIRFQLA